jgi:hypothetical protein
MHSAHSLALAFKIAILVITVALIWIEVRWPGA